MPVLCTFKCGSFFFFYLFIFYFIIFFSIESVIPLNSSKENALLEFEHWFKSIYLNADFIFCLILFPFQ